MINWFNMPDEGLSNGGLFEVKGLEVTENGTYETKGEMYNKVTVNVEGGGGSSDFSTAEVRTINEGRADIEVMIPYLMPADGDYPATPNAKTSIVSDADETIEVILYHNRCDIFINTDNEVEVTGNITSDSGGYYIVSGDGSITIKADGEPDVPPIGG